MVEPKSNELFKSGTIDDEISALNDTKSVFASPTVILPPNTMLPSILALPDNLKLEPVISPLIFTLLPVKLLMVMLEIVFPSMLPVRSIFLLPPAAKTYNASSVVE